jgi:CRISPR-associated endoribonuclease Cas6
MPARIRLILAGPPPSGPHRHADGLRAIVLGAVRRALPDLAAWLHDANMPKPIAIGPMEPVSGHDALFSVEIRCVADEIVGPLVRGLPAYGDRIVLGRIAYDIKDAELLSAATPEELAADPPHDGALPIQLLTPTAHHAPGSFRKSIVTPDPVLYVGSWKSRWNLYCAPAFSDDLLAAVAERVAIRAFSGCTRAVRLDKNRIFIGFVGWAEFIALGDDAIARDLTAAIWTLARFAEYCGTGVEVMRGMGHTRIGTPRADKER